MQKRKNIKQRICIPNSIIYNQKGITIMSLIISIVILLILSAVTIGAIKENGIIEEAQQVKTEYEFAQENGQNSINGYIQETNILYGTEQGTSNVIGNTSSSSGNTDEDDIYDGDTSYETDILAGEWNEISYRTFTNGEITINAGDKVEYTPSVPTSTKISDLITLLNTYSGTSNNSATTLTQDTSLEWRVLDVKEGKLRLISTKPATTTVSLGNANGYNNAVYLLDEVCKELYSGDRGTATSLKIEDIEDKLLWDFTSYSSTIKYGETKSYTGTYPIIHENTTGISEQTSLTTGTSSSGTFTAKQTYWYKKLENSIYFEDSVYDNIFMKDSSGNLYKYWLSSRSVHCESDYVAFSVRFVDNFGVGGYDMYYSSVGNHSEGTLSVRPVVTIDIE